MAPDVEDHEDVASKELIVAFLSSLFYQSSLVWLLN